MGLPARKLVECTFENSRSGTTLGNEMGSVLELPLLSIAEFGPGQLLVFEKGTIHALSDIFEESVVLLSLDTAPARPEGHHRRQSSRRHA